MKKLKLKRLDLGSRRMSIMSKDLCKKCVERIYARRHRQVRVLSARMKKMWADSK